MAWEDLDTDRIAQIVRQIIQLNYERHHTTYNSGTNNSEIRLAPLLGRWWLLRGRSRALCLDEFMHT